MESGKLRRPSVSETLVEGQATSRRLHIRDPLSGQSFLVDTGTDISLLPANPKIRGQPSQLKLFAANNTHIDTFGESFRTLDFGLRRPVKWNFTIAKVPYAILGADLLTHYGLLVDLRRRCIFDAETGISISAVFRTVPKVSIGTVDPLSTYAKVLADFPEITRTSSLTPPESGSVYHYISTTGSPVSARSRRLNPEKLKAAKAEFKALVEAGICSPSSSPWASPIHMILKKDGTWRIAGDFRGLNAITIPDKYPTPQLHDCASNLAGKSVFSSLDLFRAYNQIPMAPEDIKKTAVITPFGLFEFIYMTYGLRNASQTFQRYVDRVLGDLDFVFVYIDDILIASSSKEEHESHLRTVFERLKQFHLRLNTSKCVLGVPDIEFLGYLINKDGIRPTSDKVEAIKKFSKPETIAELRRFLGMVNFYRQSVPQAASDQAPLNAFLKDSRKNDKRPIIWSREAEEAFRGENTFSNRCVRFRNGRSFRTEIYIGSMGTFSIFF